MYQFIFQLLSDDKGRADEQALISLLAAAVFFALEILSVARGQSFDPLSFGAGVGTLVGVASAGLGLRAHLTPSYGADAGADH